MDIVTATGLWDGIGACPNSAVIGRVRLYKLKTQAPRPGRGKCRRRLGHPATSKPAALRPKAAAPTLFPRLRACHPARMPSSPRKERGSPHRARQSPPLRNTAHLRSFSGVFVGPCFPCPQPARRAGIKVWAHERGDDRSSRESEPCSWAWRLR
jgi:hypothetical protein